MAASPLFRLTLQRLGWTGTLWEPQTCPQCDGVFSYPKMVSVGRQRIALRCPLCDVELGSVKRKRLRVVLEGILKGEGDAERYIKEFVQQPTE